jgi:hypothetical protein
VFSPGINLPSACCLILIDKKAVYSLSNSIDEKFYRIENKNFFKYKIISTLIGLSLEDQLNILHPE